MFIWFGGLLCSVHSSVSKVSHLKSDLHPSCSCLPSDEVLFLNSPEIFPKLESDCSGMMSNEFTYTRSNYNVLNRCIYRLNWSTIWNSKNFSNMHRQYLYNTWFTKENPFLRHISADTWAISTKHRNGWSISFSTWNSDCKNWHSN